MKRNPLFLVLLAWLCVVAWCGTIFYLSSLTGHEVEKLLPVSIWDKAEHFTAFATGAVLVAAALRATTQWTWRRIMLVTALAISFYGATDEYHQIYTPGRSGLDLGDWTADTLGALAGAFGSGYLGRRWRL